MYKQSTNIIQVMMTNLKDIRAVEEVRIIGDLAVRFRLAGKMFDVRGTYPMFSVNEIEGNIMCASKYSTAIEQQLNGESLLAESAAQDAQDEALTDLLCAHVDSMTDQHVRNYNEECGGPDLDPLNNQRAWLKTHFIHIGHNSSDLLETVQMMEGKERRDTLADSIKGKLWSD